jgi:hypothetical protein
MSKRLRDIQDQERRETIAQMVVLDAHRAIRRSGCSHLDAVNARVQAAQELLRLADRDAAFAIQEGESYSEVARALEISRQAASKRYRHLHAV